MNVASPPSRSRFSAAFAHLLSIAWSRLPELAILLVALGLRLSMAKTFKPQLGYDFVDHWGYIEWVATHGSIPPVGLNFGSYHTPLYYTLGALLRVLGLGPDGIRALSFVFAFARLLILWRALELFLPGAGWRTARRAALALAAVLPTAVHLDAMLSNEPLSTMLCLAAIVGMPRLLRGNASRRAVIGTGVLCGLAVLVKISGFVLVGALVVAFGIMVYRRRFDRHQTFLRGVGPTVTVCALMAVMSGWFFVRNFVLYGHASPMSYDTIARSMQAPFEKVPYLDRRSLGFFVGGSKEIFADPYFPTATGSPSARFWPVLTASTFVDYYAYGFGPGPKPGEPGVERNGRALSTTTLRLSRVSMAGGAVIALITALSLLVCLRQLWRTGDERIVLLLVPVLAIVGQIHFVTQFPDDNMGPIKGAYVQFAAGPLFAMFGIGINWLWRRSMAGRLAAVVVGGGALLAVSAYVFYCRLTPLLR